jgi:hypothetical protein
MRAPPVSNATLPFGSMSLPEINEMHSFCPDFAEWMFRHMGRSLSLAAVVVRYRVSGRSGQQNRIGR